MEIDKKRDNDDICDNNENSNKKQKINDGDDDDYNELEKKTLLELSRIAESYGISLTNLKKSEIVDKIKAIIKRKEIEKEKLKNQTNSNPFNKTIELKITTDIHKTEHFFWKVFRNKFIFRKIMSFMDTQFSIPYNSIISFDKLIKNQLFEIIKDKVKSNNRYLIFDFELEFEEEEERKEKEKEKENKYKVVSNDKTTTNTTTTRGTKGSLKIEDSNLFDEFLFQDLDEFNDSNNFKRLQYGFYNIFKSIKNDTQFYKCLFKNYKTNFIRDVNGEGGLIDLTNTIIKSRNLQALQILIESNINNSNFKPTINNLNEAISQGATKFIKFIINNNDNMVATTITELKLLKFQNSFKGLQILIDLDPLKYKLTKPILIEIINNNRSLLYSKSTLKSLIIVINLIIGVETSNNSIKKEDIEAFKNKMDKERLESTLDDPINVFGQEKDFIKKLIDYYYSTIATIEKPLFYNLGYENLENIKLPESHDILTLKLSLNYGNFALFQYWCKKEKLFRSQKGRGKDQIFYAGFSVDEGLFNTIYAGTGQDPIESLVTSVFKNGNEKPNLLFTHCNDKEKQMKFINQVIGFMKSKSPGNDLVDPTLFFYVLISFDNLDYIKHAVNELRSVEFNIYEIRCSVTRFIRSKQVLEYLFQELPDLFQLNNQDFTDLTVWTYFTDSELLKHFVNLCTENQRVIQPMVVRFSRSELAFLNSKCISFDVLDYVLSNPTIFQLNLFEVYKLINDCYPPSTTTTPNTNTRINRFEKFKMVSSNYKRLAPVDDENSLLTDLVGSFDFIKFLNWLQINQPGEMELTSSKFFLSQSEIYSTLLITGRINDDIVKLVIDKSIPIDDVFHHISNTGNINLFKIMMKNFGSILLTTDSKNDEKKQKFAEILYKSILLPCAVYGRLEIFEFIYQDYSILLKKKITGSVSSIYKKGESGLFIISKLKELLLISLSNDYIHLSEFFFELFNVTKKEFENSSSFISKVYFNNKFNKK